MKTAAESCGGTTSAAPCWGPDPRTSLLISIAFALSVVTAAPARLGLFAAHAGMAACTAALTGCPLKLMIRRAASVLPFAAVAAAWLPFGGAGRTTELMGIELSVYGLWTLAGVSVKSFLVSAMLCAATHSTGYGALASGMRGLGVPQLFTDILGLSLRYLSLVSGEAENLSRAASARGFKPHLLPQAAIVGRLGGNLFIRSYERSERIHGAMLIRGGASPNQPRSSARLPAGDLVFLAAGLALLALARIVQ